MHLHSMHLHSMRSHSCLWSYNSWVLQELQGRKKQKRTEHPAASVSTVFSPHISQNLKHLLLSRWSVPVAQNRMGFLQSRTGIIYTLTHWVRTCLPHSKNVCSQEALNIATKQATIRTTALLPAVLIKWSWMPVLNAKTKGRIIRFRGKI